MASSASSDRAARAAMTKNYPKQLWYLVSCFLFTVALFQFASWAALKLSSKKPSSKADVEAGGKSCSRRFSLRNIPSAVVNTYRVIAFRWTIQIGSSYTLNLAEVFITCAYIIAIFVWEFVNTTDAEGKKYDLLFWGNRAGTIASAQLPLVTALGCKHNIIAYITGISYDKLNYAHRMTARVIFVLLWLHGGNWFAYENNWSHFDSWFMPIGLTGMVVFSILILVSLRPIREQAYEIFFITHFLMVFIFLLGGYFHAADMRCGSYIWPCFLIWGLDRFLRFLRVVVYNHYYLSWSKRRTNLNATVELLSPHFVRMRLSRPPHFHWAPSQTAYIIMPTVSLFPTEAHPFTIASIETQEGAVPEKGEDAPYWRELVFLINVRDGFTKRLAKAARKGEKVPVLIDGPYGFTPNFEHDNTVVLVSGGSGVAFTLSTLLGLINQVRDGKSVCSKIVFIWAIRDASHIDWISKALSQGLELAPPSLTISVLIHITSGEPLPVTNQRAFDDDSIHEESADESASHSAEKASTTISLLDFSAVQICNGRPDLHTLLRDEVSVATGRLSVTVCGSQAIARACRNALKFPVSSPSNVLKGGADVILHVESYGYA